MLSAQVSQGREGQIMSVYRDILLKPATHQKNIPIGMYAVLRKMID